VQENTSRKEFRAEGELIVVGVTGIVDVLKA
jgi:hypothetical protein